MGKGAKMKSSNKKDYRHENSDDDLDEEVEETQIVVEDVSEEKKVEHEFDISEIIEKISEKRSSTREKGLENFVKYLRSSSQTPFKQAIDNYEETLTTLLVRILKRPSSSKEGKLCCDLLNLLSLVYGANEEEFYNSFESPLKQLVQGGAIEELREYALYSLTFMAYICSPESTEFVWNFCEQILTDSAEALPYTIGLKATAAECWLLLATVMSEESVVENSAECVFEALFELLEQSSTVPGIGTASGLSGVDIKVTSGRGFAFLWEVSDSLVPAQDTLKAAAMLCHNPNTVNDVCNTIKSIAKESSKSVSKKDRKEQRFEFREIEDYIFDNEPMKETVVKFQGGEVVVDTFRMTFTLAALRKVLSGGLPSALRMLPVTKEILQIEHLTANQEETWRNKKISKKSAEDKRRSNFRTQERRYRELDTDGGYYAAPGDNA